jgi:hypothetical protein
MKTSIKLILSAIILVAISLAGYDMILRNAFLKGDYKNPYRDYVSLNFSDFQSIDVDASTIANVLVTQGPFSVKVSPYSRSFVKVSQAGGTLRIGSAFAGRYYGSRDAYIVLISCPKLTRLKADSHYTADGNLVIDSLANWDFTSRTNIIKGFAEDTLSIIEVHGSSVMLSGSKISALKAVVGIGNECRSNIVIAGDNQVSNADLNILNLSQLQLHSAHIGNLKYHLDDSAKLIQYGGTSNIIMKQN